MAEDINGNDQATASDSAAESNAQSQVDGAQTESASPTTDAAQSEPQGIAVGQQSFKDQAALAKAYQELQKGFTQKTQEYSQKLKAYESFERWLGDLRKDQAKWARFVSAVRGDQTQATPQQQQAKQPQEPGDPRISQLEQAHEEMKAQMEFSAFRQSHPELSEQDLVEVTQFVVDKDRDGEAYWTLEMAHRWLNHEKTAAKMVKKGQADAEAAITAGKKVAVLGATPSAAAAVKSQGKKQPWHATSESEQRKRIEELFDKHGVKFDEA